MTPLQSFILRRHYMTKTAKAAPLLMPLFLRGAATGASRLGNDRMILDYGKRLADMGIDPYDLPGRKADSWIDPTMTYGLSLGLGAHLANELYFQKDKDADKRSNIPLFLGTALGGGIGAYKTYKNQSNIARDILKGVDTKDTRLAKTRDYVKDKLKELDKKKK